MNRTLDVSSWNLAWPLLAATACGPVIAVDPSGTADGSGSATDSDTVDPSMTGDTPQCSVDADCDGGYDCIDGVCEYACNYCCGASPDGENHFRCSEEGFYECFDDVECGPGYICENNYCVLEPGRSCAQLPNFDASISLAFTEPGPVEVLAYGDVGATPGFLAAYGTRVARVTEGDTTVLVETGADVIDMVVTDLDGDAVGDLVVATAGPDAAVTPWLANGDVFTPGAALPIEAFDLAGGDFDGDGDTDVLARVDGELVWLEVGAGGLASTEVLLSGLIGEFAPFDRDLDGRSDLAAYVDGRYVVRTSIDGAEIELEAPAGPGVPLSLHAARFAGTGVADVLALLPDFTTAIWRGGESFESPQLDGHAGTATVAVDADFDGDGYVDLAVGRFEAAMTIIYGGSFNPDIASPLLDCSTEVLVPTARLAVGDLEGDGDLDLAYTDGGSIYVALHQ